MSNLWYQCRLRQGATETVGWIEARGARKDALVELKNDQLDDGVWRVIEVFPPGLDGEVLREKQGFDRKGLPSIERRTSKQ